MVIIVSPSQPQSTELFKKIATFRSMLTGAPKSSQESLTRMQLANGSRIISLPGSEKTTRGYSGATLVIMDEAARVPDELLAAVRPMLATTNGRFLACRRRPASAAGSINRGRTATAGNRSRSPARNVRAFRPNSLRRNYEALGPMRFAEEYLCEFHDAETSAFSTDLIEQALTDEFEPFPCRLTRRAARWFRWLTQFGVDLGQSVDPTAIAIIRTLRFRELFRADRSSRPP